MQVDHGLLARCRFPCQHPGCPKLLVDVLNVSPVLVLDHLGQVQVASASIGQQVHGDGVRTEGVQHDRPVVVLALGFVVVVWYSPHLSGS